jgi:release factor glutamine methyltransferase
MPPDPQSPFDLAAVVATLRDAGCVFAEDEAQLLVSAASSPAELAAMVEKRVTGLPLEQILGWAQFCGSRISLEPGVFVPRRRTEFLVAQAAGLAPARPVVLDLCCGSGALGVALAAAVGGVELHSCDIEPAAVRCARRNVASVGGQVYAGDLYEPLPPELRGRVDVLLANAPYVPTNEIGLMPPEARLYEPWVTLDGGGDGLDVLRRVVAGAADWLAVDGYLLVETSERQAPKLVEVFAAGRLSPRLATDDDLGATIVIGSRNQPAGPAPDRGGSR